MNRAYFLRSAPATLFSLGHLMRCGASYGSDPTRPSTHVNIYESPGGRLLDTPALSAVNMLPVSLSALSACPAPGPSRPHASLAASLPSPPADPPPVPPDLQLPILQRASRVTAEQLRRCDATEALHSRYHHPGDDALGALLDNGKVRLNPLGLTSSDVRLNRRIRGPCFHCVAAKRTEPPKPTSQSAPATAPGGVVSFDPHQLETPTEGCTHEIYLSDEHSGFASVRLSTNKSTASVFHTLHRDVALTYNRNGFRVGRFHADGESVNRSVALPLASLGIGFSSSSPYTFAQRLERSWRAVSEMSAATLHALSFYVPKKYEHYLHCSVVDARNHLITAQSSPLTPEEALTGRSTPLHLPFGTCALVLQPPAKRHALAAAHDTSFRAQPKAEVGVLMCPDPLSSDAKFLLANGQILPRRVESLLPPSFVPFNWKPKPYAPQLLPPAFAAPPPDSALPLPEANVPLQPASLDVPALAPLPPEDPVTPSAAAPADAPATDSAPTSAPSVSSQLAPVFVPASGLPPQSPVPPTPIPVLTHPPPLSPPPATPPPAPPRRSARLAAATTPTQPTPAPTPTSPAPFNSPPSAPLPPRQSTRVSVNRLGSYAQPTAPFLQLPGAFAAQRLSILQPPSSPALNTLRPSFLHCGPALSSNRVRPTFFSASDQLHRRAASQHRPAVARKLAHVQVAAARNQQHRLAHHTSPLLVNRGTLQRPVPVPPEHSEMTLRAAQLLRDPETISQALSKELTKQYITYASLRHIDVRDMEPDAVVLRNLLLFKEKLDGRFTCRMPVNGASQPADTYGSTYAGTSTSTNRLFLLALKVADTAISGKKLIHATFDVPGAFLQERLPRTATGGRQLVTRMSKDLPPVRFSDGSPGPLPGDYAELLGTVYGTKQANAIFDAGFLKLFTDNGYTQCPSDPHTLIKTCPMDPTSSLAVNLHVDDGKALGDSEHLYTELQHFLRARYGDDMKFEIGDCCICGVETLLLPNGDASSNMAKYISSFLHSAGMDNVPPALSPSLTTNGGLFAPSWGLPLSPQATKQFQSNNGGMIHMLSTRFDIQKEVKHLCSKNNSPTTSDEDKQLQLMRYLKGAIGEGPTFSGSRTSYPKGITITASSDASHAVHSADGRSHTGYTLSIGTFSSPFTVCSRAEDGGIGMSPHDSEYMALSRCCREIVYYRQFAAELGYPQGQPTEVSTDSQTSINLTTAHAIPSKSRHISQHHHFTRDLSQKRTITPLKVSTHDLPADGLTKTLGPTAFLYFRSQLFHPSTIPAPSHLPAFTV